VLLPRERFLVDKVTLPEVALDDKENVAVYQAGRLFGIESVEATLIPVDYREGQVTCLLIAVEKEVLDEIKEGLVSIRKAKYK
jgi:hypothetical protein